MNNQTRTIIGLTIIFLILISLSAAIYLNSKVLSCDKCSIDFKNTEVSGMVLDEPIIISANATYLFDNYINGSCLIKRSRTQGYYYGS